MKTSITRRDFLNGTAVTIGSAVLPSYAAFAMTGSDKALPRDVSGGYYPPTQTGMRGSHKGSFEVAHNLAWEGQKPQNHTLLDEEYDLVVVGAGASGLSAARFYQKKMGPEARILVLDNHDDFGGHARRNEFHQDGKMLLAGGGSQNLEYPEKYSSAAKSVLKDLGIDLDVMEKNMTQEYPMTNMASDVHFSIATDEGHVNIAGKWPEFLHAKGAYVHAIRQLPFNRTEQDKLIAFVRGDQDCLPDMSLSEKYEYSQKNSYASFLRDMAGLPEQSVELLDVFVRGMMGYSGEKSSVLEALTLGCPGLKSMGWLGSMADFVAINTTSLYEARYFADGNASVVRLLVAKLVPNVSPQPVGFENVAVTKFDYGALDQPSNKTRIRLNSTVVGVRHNGKDSVEIDYVTAGNPQRVNARHCILACYNSLIPYICPELPEKQKANLSYNVKIPFVFVSVALKDSQAWTKFGANLTFCPFDYFSTISCSAPTKTGGHIPPQDPADPIALMLFHSPSPKPQDRESGRDLFRKGRHILYSTSYATIENHVRQQLQNVLGEYGFNHERDIIAITVNRWSHGYAYQYMALDDAQWKEGQAPHELARKQFGRISIANSDSEARSYIDAAIDAAWRAVEEQTA